MTSKNRGLSTTLTVAAIGTAAAIIAALTATSSMKGTALSRSDNAPHQQRELSDATLMKLAGFDAQTCAVAGLSLAEARQVAMSGKSHLETSRASIRAAHQASMDAAAALARAERAVRQGSFSSDQCERLRTEAQQARGRLDLLLASLSRAATQGLSESQSESLLSLTSLPRQGLPTSYALAGLDEQSSTRLRDALADARVAQRSGLRTPPESDAVIREAQTNPKTSRALETLRSIDDYRRAWRQSLAG